MPPPGSNYKGKNYNPNFKNMHKQQQNGAQSRYGKKPFDGTVQSGKYNKHFNNYKNANGYAQV